MDSFIANLAIWALPVIFAITLHEAAHGYAARLFGDPTAWLEGRISLNPLRHIDPVGTLLVPGMLLLVSALTGGQGFLFGWAKPVPVNFGRLRNPKKNMLWVAAAGPMANLFMACCWALLLKLAITLPDNLYTTPLARMSEAGIEINLVLMLVNLVPVPPLDGGRIAVSLLPFDLAVKYARLEPYGLFILLGLIYFRILDVFLWPLMIVCRHLLSFLFQI